MERAETKPPKPLNPVGRPCAHDAAPDWRPAYDLAQEAAAMRRLWAAVMLTALADAELDPAGPPGFYIASADFRAVAELAGLDGAAAQGRVAAMARARIEAARAAADAAFTPDPKRRAASRASRKDMR
jgi:hypothetical protein